MTTPGAASPTKAQGLGLIAGSGIAAISTFVIMWLVNRGPGHSAARYAEFQVYWAFIFWLFSVTAGLMNEGTRAAGSALKNPDGPHPSGARIQLIAGVLALMLAILTVATSPLWGAYVAPSTVPAILPAMVIGIVFYGSFQAFQGQASGRGQWNSVIAVVVLDAVARLMFVGLAAWGIKTQLGNEIAVTIAGGLFLLIVLVPSGRAVFCARADVGSAALARRMTLAMLSAAASGLLIVAFPTLIQITNPGGDEMVKGGTMTALSLTRAPIMMPLLAFQGVAIKAFLAHEQASLRPLLKPVGAVTGIGLIGAPVAALLGPWLLNVAFVDVHASAWTFGLLVVAAVPLAVLTLTGAILIALDRHVWFAAGWLGAAACATALLLVPTTLPVKVVTALIVGPTVGIGIHALGVLHTHRRGAVRT